MKNILITGANGFIGKNLLRILEKKNYNILAISTKEKKNTKNIVWLKADISKINSKIKKIINFAPNIIVHLAWQGIPKLNKKNSEKSFKDSVIFFNNVCKNVKINKIICLGSCLEYKYKNGFKSENDQIDNKNYFSKYKNKLRKFVKKISNENKISFAWLRVFYIYGIGQRKGSLINFILNISKIKNKKLKFRNPYNKNDYIYIDDFNKLMIKIINRKFKSEIFNVGTTISYSPVEILDKMNDIMNTNIKSINDVSKKNIFNFRANINKTKKVFDWSPKINMQQGLKFIIKNKYYKKSNF